MGGFSLEWGWTATRPKNYEKGKPRKMFVSMFVANAGNNVNNVNAIVAVMGIDAGIGRTRLGEVA